jgi:hypothetical protein
MEINLKLTEKQAVSFARHCLDEIQEDLTLVEDDLVASQFEKAFNRLCDITSKIESAKACTAALKP